MLTWKTKTIGAYYHFTASRITGNGNAVFPDEIIIDDLSKHDLSIDIIKGIDKNDIRLRTSYIY